MIKAVFVDMDNTLVANQYLYDEARASLRGYMRHFGVLPGEVDDVFATLDKDLFKTYGYSEKRMPASFEAVLRHFVPDADDEMAGIVRSFAESIFDTVARVKGGTVEAINTLTSKYPVYIVTAGPETVQKKRIAHLPFRDKLAGDFVVSRKDKQTYLDIAAELGLKPEEIVMIGDSIKSDIFPPVEAGMQAIWLEAYNSAHEEAAGFPAERAYRFSSLEAAASHLVKHGTPEPKKKPATPKPK